MDPNYFKFDIECVAYYSSAFHFDHLVLELLLDFVDLVLIVLLVLNEPFGIGVDGVGGQVVHQARDKDEKGAIAGGFDWCLDPRGPLIEWHAVVELTAYVAEDVDDAGLHHFSGIFSQDFDLRNSNIDGGADKWN